ncbi:hypothetical protein ACFPL7_22330 [Dongia soli]|uniref:Lipoprotein n=1 Tax=Dongia soli TaxID=600628 RepID=A0ABU5E804_9PROT|nr:hypothetical protein [Dongia soli]MDY0882329.1 hypothetical protein [Dongia soli]
MKKFILLAALCSLLSGCVSANMHTYGTPDRSERSVTVPPGGGLTAEIKEVFKRNGWTMVVDRGPQVTSGSLGSDTHLEKYDTFNTRYRLMLDYSQFDICLGHMDGAYNYNMSFVDNKTGEELMAMGGRACQSQILDKLQQFLSSSK